MTDRELLELAARAAGMKGEYHSHDCDDGLPPLQFLNIDGGRSWAPLDDDGDALRLAVRLGFALSTSDPATACGSDDPDKIDGVRIEYHDNDPYAATRRAIVRAAAEIGKTK